MEVDTITSIIIEKSINIHKALGPGLLESAYKECLAFELLKSGLHLEKEKPVPLIYKGVELNCGYRIDLHVENKVVVEIKSVEGLAPIHVAQVLTYLKLINNKIGLLINFNEELLKDGIMRLYNKHYKPKNNFNK
ncbi:MAG TPA: GxxExxY protein [Ignavibacteriaceae bacterium]|nr:GxxExxY protein [Ignavibacteriaceae bacterium]